MSNFKKNSFSPTGLLQWAYIFGTDSEGKYADDKYKVTHRYYGEDAKKIKSYFESLEEEARKELSKEGNKHPITDEDELFMPFKEARDKDKKVIPDCVDIVYKTNNPPIVVDGARKELKASDIPGYKDGLPLGKGVVCFKPRVWQITDRRGNTEYGVSSYLQAVQITELSTGAVDLSGFDEYDDGFVASESTDTNDDEGDMDDLPDFAS